ncbi:carbohydrate kinase family protein [Pseudomonas fluorescens]|uniref:Nucleoside 2-deoxyribosyltransferase n=1 Tax=Pseudomonas fluorescens TaxID=294 RepID=A0A0F4V785_PSEFL|nr:carbohydrate kinase family protein [Pseudomonas fluorescens]KJZ64365.1 nucleoside 2-deoxyribosyltransferase [Pseudomonas fluorescens]
MHIVGGLYRELCEVPSWDSTMGSGVRAALAAMTLSPDVELSTFASLADQPAVTEIRSRGIVVNVQPRASAIVFAYFHPLSFPHIEPPRGDIEVKGSILVTGDAVLRFGFIEGDAVVTANRAVYDPQTWRNPPSFWANGSTANELALVMNELELRHIAGIDELATAAQLVLQRERACAIVVKRGTRGASIYEATGKVTHVPAYRSNRVFKLGTGDVFSAVFAVYWAEKNLSPAEAADLASRSVSVYCDTLTFEFDEPSLRLRQPVSPGEGGKVRLEGAIRSLGQRYLMEETRCALRELGIEVLAPELNPASLEESADATLIINNELSAQAWTRITQDAANAVPVIILNEHSMDAFDLHYATLITEDFTTAIYFAAWAAEEAVAPR